MKLENHPFNDSYGISSITETTSKLILGTFPAYEVTSNISPRLSFYYGSKDSKFWDLFYAALEICTEVNEHTIKKYLENNNFGIIDIIRKCYRKKGKSSVDADLSIIEFEDIMTILFRYKIDKVYTTSKLATKLFKQQIKPLLNREKRKLSEIFVSKEVDGFTYEEVQLSSETFCTSKELKIITLYSPSKTAKKGIKKAIDSKLNMNVDDFILKQYAVLLKI